MTEHHVNNKMSAAVHILCKILCLILVTLQVSADRKVSTKIFECTLNSTICDGVSIAHIKSEGKNDARHYVLSPIGLPTVFVAYTGPGAALIINWTNLVSPDPAKRQNSIKIVNTTVNYSFSILFSKLIEYNDTQDYADMSKYDAGSTHWNMYDLQDFSWEKLSTVSDIKSNSITFKASDKTQQELWKNNGTFSIKFNAFGSEGREDQLPHLQYNENLTQFDMNIDHIMTNFTDSRFAVEILTVGGDSEPMYVDKTRSIDDEYAPGVFQIYNWMTRSNHRDQTGFLQWKPVAYNALKRARNKATSMKHYALQDLTMDQKNQVDDTIVYAFYGETVLDKSMKKAQNFSFGIAKDGGYNKTRVLTWSGSIGYGSPPADAISTVVIIIILAGLGLPIVIIIFGGIFVCMKKRSNRPDKQLKAVNSTGYQPILDSDR